MSVLSVSENILVKNYRDLKVWQKSILLSKNIYKIVETFPSNQQYGLRSQIERSSVSVASNIAEGSGRNGTSEFIYHLGIARGSLLEVETQLIIANEVGFISQDALTEILKITEEINRMINGLIIKLKQKKCSTNT